MNMGAGVLWAVAAVGLSATLAAAQKDQEHARPRLVCETTSVAPGKTAWFGVAFDIDPGWHLYYNGQNDSGFPVKIETTLPDGFKAGEILWPAPVRHESPGDLLDHIYEKRVTLLLPVEVPASAAGSSVLIKANADWLVCKSACLPGSASLSLAVPVAAAKEEPVKGRDAGLFAEARSLLPKNAAGQKDFEAVWEDGALVLKSLKDKELAFYPGPESAPIQNLIKTGASKDGRLEVRPEKPGKVAGIVEIGPPDRKARTLYRLETAPPGVNSPAARPSNPSGSSGG